MAFRGYQGNFTKGVLSPELYARFDADMYHAAVKQGRNVLIMKYGGLTKRMGTHLVDEVLEGNVHRLVPFQFSLDQSYVLEFGPNYMAPVAHGGRVVDAGGAYSITSPFPALSITDFDYEQTTDTIYMAHIDHPPQKLQRAGHTNWSFAPVTFGPNILPPVTVTAAATVANTDPDNSGKDYWPRLRRYAVTAVNDDTGQESRASTLANATNDLTLKKNRNTISWSMVAGATRYKVYKQEESNALGYIGTTVNLTFVDDNIQPALDQPPPTAFNPFNALNNYPSTITLFEQRSVWGRTRVSPNAMWLSRSGQMENMDKSIPAVESDSIGLGIAAGRVNSINQLASTTSLIALASDGIFTVSGAGEGGIMTGNNAPSIKRQIGHGASRLKPLTIDNVVFYVPAVGSSVRTMNYSLEADGMKASDMTIFSPHFFTVGKRHLRIVSWCYAQEPWSIIWAVREDGKLLAFTWEQEQQVWGWTEIETDGKVISVCSINEQGQDYVYLIVERTWGGIGRRFIERMATPLWDDAADAVFMDCAISAEFATARRTFTGLDHLNGRTDVCGIADGNAVAGLTVTGGMVTLPDEVGAAKRVSFGIPYKVTVETLPIKTTVQGSGANVGRRQQVGDIVLTLKDTRGVMAGNRAQSLYVLKSRTNEPYGSPTRLMNGEFVMSTDNAATNEVSAYIEQDLPLPFTLLGVGRDMVLHER